MNTDLMIKNLYQKSYEHILNVYEVFKDYFDEERVDLQDISTMKIFENRLRTSPYSNYLNKSFITSSEIFKNYDESIQIIIKALLEEGALKSLIASDNTVFKYLYPFLYDKITLVTSTASILVHFPNVRVTNENDKYVDIKDLYARVRVTHLGNITGTFGLNRTDYPLSHLLAGYMHSHISGTNMSNPTEFKSPCLGSGPINDTILTLATNNDINMWMLFCRELDLYVRVESLEGVPYKKLEHITGTVKLDKVRRLFDNNNLMYTVYINIPQTILKDFIFYLVRNNIIKFNYSNKSINLAMSYLDYIIAVSNAFIEFVNTNIKIGQAFSSTFTLENLISERVLARYVIKNNTLYKISNNNSGTDLLRHNGKSSFIFKGNTLHLNIYNDSQEESNNEVLLLNRDFCYSLLFKIISYLNINYGKSLSNQISEARSYKEYITI